MRAPGARGAELSICTAGGETQIVSLERERYDLGRDNSNALSFPAARGLSRKHLAFEHNGSSWLVRDLGSTNGTFVNGIRIAEPQVLRSNDRVVLGDITIVFSDASGPAVASLSQTVVFVDKTASAEAPTLEATLDGVLHSDEEMQGSPHMRALVRAGRELCAHNSLDELFEVILNLSVEAVPAPRGVLMTFDDGDYRVRASKGAGFRISSHVRDLVVNERRSLITNDALTDESLSARMSIVQQQIRGILAVPLQTERNVIGLIYLDSPEHIKAFTRNDLNVLTVLANIAAIRVEQARLAEIEQAEKVRARELEHAAQIQRSILPGECPPFPDRKDFQLHAAMVPAKEVGGDFFDYFLLDEDQLAFVIGDVSGKGVPAALFMAVTRTLLRATAQNRNEPGECFTYMNKTLAEQNTAGMFVTLFYGVLNTRTGDLEFANAGHNPPLVYSRDGGVRRLSQKSGPLLGLLEGCQYKTIVTRIAPGEGILLYTDGITEAVSRANEFYGDDALEGFLGEHASMDSQPMVLSLQTAVQQFANGMPQADDITVLALRYVGKCPDPI